MLDSTQCPRNQPSRKSDIELETKKKLIFKQSAVMAGLKVIPVKVHQDGNLDLQDLREKAEKHKDKLAAFMVRASILSTGVFYRDVLDHIPFHFRRVRGWCTRCNLINDYGQSFY